MTIGRYADTWSAAHYGNYHTHFRNIAGYVFSENLDTALIVPLALIPPVGVASGTLGGGFHRPRRPG